MNGLAKSDGGSTNDRSKTDFRANFQLGFKKGMLSRRRNCITDAGITPGIKVDTGAKDLAVIPDEN